MFKRLMQQVDRALGRGVIDDQLYDELEEALLQADTHIQTAQEILEELRRAVRDEKITDPVGMKSRLKQSIADRMRQDGAPGLIVANTNPTVFVFVGVNGVGKTTTIAKVAHLLKRKGFSVMMAAGDTFRAAAIEQLETWANRIGCEIVRSQQGGDSGAIIFDAIQAAKARGIEFVLADTAGRQHSKQNLMMELQKVSHVAEKSLGRPPDEVLLVLDANTGQNAVRQAEEFTKVAGITGIVLTKLDGTAKGGAMLGLYKKFKVPVKFIGIGEKVGDL
ncbi:MAG: signal recognition particle-docking protein FtsY, partial [Fimbriimonadaceae bacterium]